MKNTSMATSVATNKATKCQAGSDKHVHAVNHFLAGASPKLIKFEPYLFNCLLLLVQPNFHKSGMTIFYLKY